MILISKEQYIQEVQEIKSEELRIKLEALYNHYTGAQKIDNVKQEVKHVIRYLFIPLNDMMREVVIPFKFLDTKIGTVLMSIYYNQDEKLYSLKDIGELTINSERSKGLSKQWLNKEIAAGNLIATLKSGRYYVTESEFKRYLNERGY